MSVESRAVSYLRRIWMSVTKGNVARVNGTLAMDVAAYLLNKKRKELTDVENRYGVSIILEGDPSIPPGGGKLDFVQRRRRIGKRGFSPRGPAGFYVQQCHLFHHRSSPLQHQFSREQTRRTLVLFHCPVFPFLAAFALYCKVSFQRLMVRRPGREEERSWPVFTRGWSSGCLSWPSFSFPSMCGCFTSSTGSRRSRASAGSRRFTGFLR
jgi:hypothetical protein